MRIEDAYNELGLELNANLQKVRSRYIELAKKHHPDKQIGKTDEEIKENEEKFKKITNAYHKIIDKDDTIDYNDINWMSKLWVFFKDPELWDSIKDIINTISKKENKHIITVPLTLEEIHTKKQKKLRLFLKNIKDPIFCTIDCSKYPGYTYYYTNEVIIEFIMRIKDHEIYKSDDLINMWDLYTTVKISWLEYIEGKDLSLKYLDDTYIHITIPPFPDFNKVKIESGKGLCLKGDLYICYEMENISKNKWQLIDENKKIMFLNAIKSLG